MNVSLRQIEVFLAVAKTMSFSQAARLCHLSQPALSANVKRLEDTLGARLFDRHTRKVALTPVGQEFMSMASAMTESMALTLARMQDFVAGKRGRVVVAAAPSMAASFAPGVIAHFSQRHPEIDIELHDELSDVCVDMVRSGAADLALAPFKQKADDLVQLELFRDPLVVICPADHALTQRANVRWRDVQAYPHIVMNASSGVRQLIDTEFARHNMRLRPAFEVAHVGTMLGLIGANLGIGELPRSLIENIGLAGLTALRIDSAAAYRTICAITPKNRTLSPPVTPFLEICRKMAQPRAAVHAGARRGRRASA
ncbi:MAG: LysR family transcriptional regulator [Variovorax sp.]|nr:MAG: LysR family transcriptional regulator [Variovorax sp.]